MGIGKRGVLVWARLEWTSSMGRHRDTQEEARDSAQRGPHLQLCLQTCSLTQERGHHFICNWELVWDLRTPSDQAWVEAIEVLVPKEAVLRPMLNHIL